MHAVWATPHSLPYLPTPGLSVHLRLMPKQADGTDGVMGTDGMNGMDASNTNPSSLYTGESRVG